MKNRGGGRTNQMKKILVVDDSFAMRLVLKEIIPKKYQIIEADSAETALTQFENEHPDLVLLDIVMPGGDEAGIDVLQKLMKGHPTVRIVMLSAVGQDAVIERCRKLGALDYLVKPFDDKIVPQTIDHFIA